jgi:hypothetical protein
MRRLGSSGTFIALAMAYSGLARVSGLLFKRGRWRQITV